MTLSWSSIDNLLEQIPDGWDFWIGSSWNEVGESIFTARLLRRADDHLGHYSEEIEREASSLSLALSEAIAALPEPPNAS